MKHVFSNYLKKYWLNDINGKLKDVFHEINTSYNKSDKYLVNVLILNDFHILCTDLSTTEFYFQCYTNKHLMDVIKWINRNIIVNIESDVQLTTEIKMRIAIGMINKLVYQRRLSDSHGKHAVDSLIANIREIRNLMIDEELPFLGIMPYSIRLLSRLSTTLLKLSIMYIYNKSAMARNPIVESSKFGGNPYLHCGYTVALTNNV